MILREVVRHLRKYGPRIPGRSGDPLVHELHHGFAAEGNIRGEHFVHDEAQGIYVRAMIHVDGFHLLGGHVARGAENLSGARHHGDFGFQRFGQSEIGDVDVVGIIHEDILRLQVAVDHAFVMCRFECGAQLAREFEGAVEGQASFLVDQAGEIAAFDEGHGDELDAANVAEIVDAQDVLLRDLAGEQELLFEALHGLRIRGQLRADQFQRDGAAELGVVGLVDRAHSAFAEQRFDAVASAECGARL